MVRIKQEQDGLFALYDENYDENDHRYKHLFRTKAEAKQWGKAEAKRIRGCRLASLKYLGFTNAEARRRS
jgi:hypothetical protein